MNQHIKIKGKDEKKRWTLIYPTAPEQINHSFYSQLPGISIADLLRFVAKEAGFLNAFTHVLGRYTKQAPDAREIFACIVGYGTNMGLGKMAEVSGMGHASLMTTARNFLRPETLHSAIDAISNAIAKLPVFGLFKYSRRVALQQRRPAYRDPDQHLQCPTCTKVFRPGKGRERFNGSSKPRADKCQGYWDPRA